MRRALSYVLMMCLLAVPTVRAAGEAAQRSAVLTFLESRAEAAPRAERDLRRYAQARQEADPNIRILALAELDRPGHFVLLERASGGEHPPRAPDVRAEEWLEAPADTRTHRVVAGEVDFALRGASAGDLYVIAHLDIAAPPTAIGDALEALSRAARASLGNRGFEVWQQTGRPNHFNLVSRWDERADLERFCAGEAARAFRARVAGLLGSPFDQRLYCRIPQGRETGSRRRNASEPTACYAGSTSRETGPQGNL